MKKNKTKQDANQRIKNAFPDLQPSGDYDYVDEIIGILRVTRGHLLNAENQCAEYRKALSIQRNTTQKVLDLDKIETIKPTKIPRKIFRMLAKIRTNSIKTNSAYCMRCCRVHKFPMCH